MTTSAPVIACTPGEPAGVGPDLVVRLAQEPLPYALVLVADRDLLVERARRLGLPFEAAPWEGRAAAAGLYVAHHPLDAPCTPGRLDARNAPYVMRTLERAVEGCLRREFHALVTGPVQKSIINDAGIPFTGHTEFLAERSGTPLPVMMLATPALRVALATTHLPLAEVSRHITADRLKAVLRILHGDLQSRFRLPSPRIAVCGLNPHAGEGGHLGREEIDVIEPALRALADEGLRIAGPIPADTAFTPAKLRECDAVLAMYHDQGLPVLKHHDFANAVNVTLGLPFVRTSVDHGTALDLAGSDRADVSSFRAALRMAHELAGR